MNDAVNSPWADLVALGTRSAMSGLSQMIGAEIAVSDFSLRRVPVAEVSKVFGGPETEAVGIYVTVSGSADGHMMLMYEPKIAYAFVDLLMGDAPNTTTHLTEMGRSALAEMGNVIGAFFLAAIADATGLLLSPSPPEVMTDMAGALFDVISVNVLLRGDETYLAEATFSAQGHDISGVFMVLPTDELMDVLVAASKAA